MSRARAKGTAAETALRDWLQRNGHSYAERLALGGTNDRGDITGIPGVVLEVKNCKTFDLAGWLDELAVEMANADVSVGAVVAKRRGTTDRARWYAVMPVEVLNRLLTVERVF